MNYRFMLVGRIALGIGMLLLASAADAAPKKNVLFFGNSFTFGAGSSRSVPDIFDDIVIAAGHDDPNTQESTSPGVDLLWHTTNSIASIYTKLPPAEDWDAIVMQQHSTKMTRAYTGSPSFPASLETSKQSAVSLYNSAKARSANVVPVLYETWARGPAHGFYQGSNPLYTGPSEMQAEVRAGYDALKEAIDTDAGQELALIAPVGDAWEEANYDRLHSSDNWHAQNRGSLLAALVIYGTVYDDPTTSDIDLSGVLQSLNLNATDGVELTSAADSVLAVPEPTASLICGACCLVAGAANRRVR